MNTKIPNTNHELYLSCQFGPDSYKQAIFFKKITQKNHKNLLTRGLGSSLSIAVVR